MRSKEGDIMINEYIEPIPNVELRAIFPKMQPEEFAKLKHDISVSGVLKEIDIMPCGFIVDGYNRYHAVQELKKEGKLPETYQIPEHILANMNQIQEAKEYTWRMNAETRRQLTAYQIISAALRIFQTSTQEEIAKKLKTTQSEISKVSKINEIIGSPIISEKVREFKEGLESGRIEGYDAVYDALQSAIKVDKEIASITNPIFKEQMTEEWEENKYKKNALKRVETEIEEYNHPKRTKNYYDEIAPIITKLDTLEKKFPDKIDIIDVTTDEKFKEAANWLLERRGNTKGYSIVVFYEIPKECLP